MPILETSDDPREVTGIISAPSRVGVLSRDWLELRVA
jgi:hypothetical protein